MGLRESPTAASQRFRDITHVIFDRGTGPFNEAAALEAYHLVAKMDDETALEFVYHVTNEVLETTLEQHKDVLQKHLDRTVAKMLVTADLDEIAKGLDADQREQLKAELIGAVSKAEWDEQASEKHPRGQGGRFRSKDIIHHEGAPMSGRVANELGIPKHRDQDTPAMSADEKAQYQQEYLQIAHLLDDNINGQHDVVATKTTPNGVEKVKLNTSSPATLAAQINPHHGETITHVDAEVHKPALGGRAYDLTRSLGAGGLVGANAATASGFADQWNVSNPRNENERLYSRVAAGSKVLGAAGEATGNQKLQVAGKFGSWVGQHGPRAEAVFGPPTRKMAYRYRGTEKRPDRALVGAYGNAINTVKGANGKHASQAAANAAVPTWSEREAGREQVIGYLRTKAKVNGQLTNLHLAAGHTPPSQGVLINRDGQIVTQAVGYGDDWYLPFNLKNLKDLKGGEYVRTRTSGGLTGEDIYTGLMAGARRVTVVSNSGVFTIDFDKDFRGGRRYNDQALRMANRYDQLLDAVQSESVTRIPVAEEDKRKIADEVDHLYGPDQDPKQRQDRINAGIKAFQANPTRIDEEMRAAQDEHEARFADRAPSKDEAEAHKAKMLGLASQKQFVWKLDGMGYQAAQDALAEQFPFYIESAPNGFLKGTKPIGGRDPGYIEPGANRPHAARGNLFGGRGNPDAAEPRISAADMNHARSTAQRQADYRTRNKPSEEREASAVKPGEAAARPAAPAAKAPVNDPEVAQRIARNNATAAAAAKMQGAMRSWIGTGDVETDDEKTVERYAKMDPTDFRAAMKDPAKASELRDALESMGSNFEGRQEFMDSVPAKSVGAFDYDRAVANPEGAFEFPNATPAEKEAAAQRTGLSGKQLGQLSAPDLKREATILARAEDVAGAGGNEDTLRSVLRTEGITVPSSSDSLLRVLMGDKAERQRYMSQVKLTQASKVGVRASEPAAERESIAAPAPGAPQETGHLERHQRASNALHRLADDTDDTDTRAEAEALGRLGNDEGRAGDAELGQRGYYRLKQRGISL